MKLRRAPNPDQVSPVAHLMSMGVLGLNTVVDAARRKAQTSFDAFKASRTKSFAQLAGHKPKATAQAKSMSFSERLLGRKPKGGAAEARTAKEAARDRQARIDRAVEKDRTRCVSIVHHGIEVGAVGLACRLAFESDVSAAAAVALIDAEKMDALAAAPPPTRPVLGMNSLDRAMASLDIPIVRPMADTPDLGSPQGLAAQILSAGERARPSPPPPVQQPSAVPPAPLNAGSAERFYPYRSSRA